MLSLSSIEKAIAKIGKGNGKYCPHVKGDRNK